MTTRTQRLFFALLPPSDVASALHETARRCLTGAGQPIPSPNLHLTLQFLGSLDASGGAAAARAGAGLRAPSFTLVLDELGCFERARVAWSGPTRPPPALLGLVRSLGTALDGNGLAMDPRPFRAHVTLARKIDKPFRATPHRPIEWLVDEFALVRSVNLGSGVRYQAIERWPLRGALA